MPGCLFCAFVPLGVFEISHTQKSTGFEARKKSELKFHLLGQVTQFLNGFVCEMWITVSNSRVSYDSIKLNKAFKAFRNF